MHHYFSVGLVNSGISDSTGRHQQSILGISSLVNKTSLLEDSAANFSGSLHSGTPTWMPSGRLGEPLSGARVWRNSPGLPADTKVRIDNYMERNACSPRRFFPFHSATSSYVSKLKVSVAFGSERTKDKDWRLSNGVFFTERDSRHVWFCFGGNRGRRL